MVESTTKNYSWTKPEVTKSASTWGGFLNTDLDSIDALVFANQQGIAPIGSITMFAGATAPPNWLICAGQQIDTTVYAKLFAVIGNTYGGVGTAGNFLLPNLAAHFPWGANAGNALGTTGGATTITLDSTMIPAHTHAASQPAHGHAATQAAHSHVIATGGHSHAIHTGAHSHTVPNAATFTAGSGFAGGSGAQIGNQTTSTAGDLGGNTDAAGNLGGNTDSQAPGITVPAAQPAITVANAGGGLPHNNMPPWLAINFIIRYQ